MKTIIFFLFGFTSIALAAQRPRISGYVTEMNSGKKNVKGVLVKTTGFAKNNQVTTLSDGSFTLIFQDMTPGQTVVLDAQKAGWVMVNQKEMKAIIPTEYTERSFVIVMCPKQKLEQSKKDYYHITDYYIKRAYKKRLDSIDRSKKGWQQKVKYLDEDLARLRQQVTQIANEYSTTNLDDLSGIEKRAIQLFKAGKIEESIKLRETMKSGEELRKANEKKRALDSVIHIQRDSMRKSSWETVTGYQLQVLSDTSSDRYCGYLTGLPHHIKNQLPENMLWLLTK